MLAHAYMITCKFHHQHRLQSAAITPFRLPLTLVLASSIGLFCLVTTCWNFRSLYYWWSATRRWPRAVTCFFRSKTPTCISSILWSDQRSFCSWIFYSGLLTFLLSYDHHLYCVCSGTDTEWYKGVVATYNIVNVKYGIFLIDNETIETTLNQDLEFID